MEWVEREGEEWGENEGGREREEKGFVAGSTGYQTPRHAILSTTDCMKLWRLGMESGSWAIEEAGPTTFVYGVGSRATRTATLTGFGHGVDQAKLRVPPRTMGGLPQPRLT